MKKHTIITILILVITIGFFTGFYLYRIKQIEYESVEEFEIGDLIEDECTAIANSDDMQNLVSTNSNNKKTSPNCTIILKIYYKKCGHLIENKKTIEEAEVNLTEEELKEKFSDWEIQKFTEKEIVLYKEVDSFCDEHYVLREQNGNISIFKIDENNNESFLKETDITVQYLEDEDLRKIKEGIFINTKKELNRILEDFE